MAITRITAVWSGFRGAPGYSNFFFGGSPTVQDDADSAATAVRNFFGQMMDSLPQGVSINIQPVADVLDEASGNITEQVDIEPLDPLDASGSTSYSAASGAVVHWNTAAYRNGRRIRGRTFLVPLGSDRYDEQGDLTSGAIADIRRGANYLTSGTSVMPFVVWSRPVGGAGGSAEPVTSATIPDMGAILRSRRD